MNNILLVDDDRSLWPLLMRKLGQQGFNVGAADNLTQARTMLNESSFDALVVDYQLNNECGLELLDHYSDLLPCILVTAQGDESVAVNAMKNGAQDYVVKDTQCLFLDLLPDVCTNAIERHGLKRRLERTQIRMRKIFDEAQDLMLVTNNEFEIIEASQAAVNIYQSLFKSGSKNLLDYIDQSLLDQILNNEFQFVPAEIPLKDSLVPFQIYCHRLNDKETLFVFRNQTNQLEAEEKIRQIERIEQEKRELIVQNHMLAQQSNFDASSIIGLSKQIQTVKQTIANVADTSANVLVHGETGTGKELVAYEIHCQSDRKHGPLVKLNCGAIPENLVESELFGHVKGAFTGAIRDHKGKFEQAHGGTLFLDEIGELNLNVQVKLLRVLQESQVEPVGGSKTINIDVRIVAATHRNLGEMVNHGQFRADLFYRLNVIPLSVPPLRQRIEDIPLLANHFVTQFRSNYNRNIPDLTENQLTFLQQQAWTGNVRELRNTLERWVILGQLKTDEQLDSQLDSKSPKLNLVSTMPENLSLDEIERQHIIKVLDLCQWKISGNNGAARVLELNPSTLRFRMKKLKIVRST